MTKTETIADYARRLEDIFDKLAISDEATKVNTFVQGLQPETRTKLILMKPTSFYEAEQSCSLLESTEANSFETNVMKSLHAISVTLDSNTSDNAKSNIELTTAATTVEHNSPAQQKLGPKPKFQNEAYPSEPLSPEYSYRPRYNYRGNEHDHVQTRPPRPQYFNPRYRPPQNNFLGRYQFNSQNRTDSPFCNRCGTTHLWGQHVVDWEQPGTRQNRSRPLNSGNQQNNSRTWNTSNRTPNNANYLN